MIRVVIIEDEFQSQKLLKQIIEDYCPGLVYSGLAQSVPEAKILIESSKPDLVFLDVELKDDNGFALLDSIVDKSFKVIFTTAYDQYAVKAFKYEAVDYILKPYSPKDIIAAVEKVKLQNYDQDIFKKLDQLIGLNKINGTTHKIELSSIEGIQMLEVESIIRVEASGSYSTIYIRDRKPIVISKLIKDLESQLPAHQFYRTHKSHLVNLDCVSEYKHEDGGYAIMTNKNQIPVARRRKDDFLNHWSKYIAG